MKTINQIGVTEIGHGEMANLVDNILKIIKKHLSNDKFLMTLVVIIDRALQHLNAAITAVRGNSQVELLQQQDEIRDDAFITFKNAVLVYERTRNEDKQQAFQHIWDIIGKAGSKLYIDGLNEESARLAALFQELNKKENQAELALLNVTPFYKELVEAQEKYEDISQNKVREESSKDLPTLRECRGEINPLIADLLPTLNNVLRVAMENNKGESLNWADEVNEHLNKVSALVAARRTRNENQEELTL